MPGNPAVSTAIVPTPVKQVPILKTKATVIPKNTQNTKKKLVPEDNENDNPITLDELRQTERRIATASAIKLKNPNATITPEILDGALPKQTKIPKSHKREQKLIDLYVEKIKELEKNGNHQEAEQYYKILQNMSNDASWVAAALRAYRKDLLKGTK